MADDNVIQFPGKPVKEDGTFQIACPEEDCGNTFFQALVSGEGEVTIECGRCGYALEGEFYFHVSDEEDEE